ncbi:thiol reductant ABC exporter subunit CydC [Spirilliplanes yamanashiensis]|uniref:ATP-binding cassette subfamily C protein CydCD n=1 Tax=Spirilliplanes yamanashiensis TaxID=42233 RepID=A0A8J3YCH2_9ACTN|nr:thiol reductant ABC exporter subunit CydC [Spirilliplanes yamanashiensis]MDP9818995.1 ATP-binding cassette subfamily C protein CydCD [Spirilliplanes yamanashiensis]GIJ05450.1 hypothetical protein Sya03_48020 [Spirilliplanes yamanashiensis]
MSGPLDPRLLRRAPAAAAGLAALGAAQAACAIAVAAALTGLIAWGSPWAPPLLAAALATRAALAWADQVVAHRAAARVTDALRRDALAAALRHGPAWLAGYGPGRLTAALTTGLDALRPWFAGYLPSVVLGVLLPPLVVLLLFAVDPASAVVVLLTLPLVPLFGALIGWATQRRAAARWAAGVRLAGHFLDVVHGLGTLRLYGRAHRQAAAVAAMSDRHRTATMGVLRVAFLSSTALDLVGTLSVGVVAVGAGVRVATGDMPLAPALLAILLAPEAYRPLREMAARYHATTDASAVVTDLDEILRATPAPPPAPPGGRPSIVATGLRVRHPGAPADTLTLDHLAVAPGEVVALRGASGAGKTTALRVLAGLQTPTAGTTTVTGTVHYLPQRPALPHARTVADALGDDLPPATVRRLLHPVALDTELPDPTTPLADDGHGISSGQRQRLALARLLHDAALTPAVLLLDEPTAHLDATAEHRVVDLLRSAAARGCAVLVVAHRPAVLTAADRIVDVTRPAPADGPSPSAASAGPTSSPLNAAGPDFSPTAAGLEPSPTTWPEPSPTAAGPGPFPAAAGPRPSSAAAGPSTTTVPDPLAAAGGPASSPSAAIAASPSPITAPSVAGRRRGWGVAAVGFGAGSWVAGVVLTAAAGWLLVRAAALPPILTLSTAVVLVRGSAVARPLLRYLERLVAHDVAFARLGGWRAEVYAALVPGAGRVRRGEVLTRAVDDVDARVDGLLRGRLPAAAAGLALAAGVAALAAVAPATATVVAAGFAVAGLLAPALAGWLAGRLDARTGQARAALRDAVVETAAGLEELAGRADALAVPDRRSRDLSTLESRAAWSSGAAAALAHLGCAAAVLGTAATTGGLPAEVAALVLLAVVALTEPALTLPEAAVARRRARGAHTRLATLTTLTTPPAATAQPAATTATTADALVLDGVVAGWDPRTPALRGLTLRIPAGGSVAVVGPSGAGKSTLAAVAAGLLTPAGGRVRRAGRVALVGDGFDHVFASTVRENLRLARPGASDAELVAVLRRVRLGEWLAGLPAGLGTWLGTGGATMSGGERRRFVTARALLVEPDLLILDEPTEGLDEPAAEALMADLLGAGGPAVLLLTHRQEGLDRVDAVRELGAVSRPYATA